jgi:putative phosphoribosyl transferase
MAEVPHPQDIEILPLGLKGLLSGPDGASRAWERFKPAQPAQHPVASAFNQAGLTTLLFDLLLPSESEGRHKVFDIPLLAGRLDEALDWIEEEESTTI